MAHRRSTRGAFAALALLPLLVVGCDDTTVAGPRRLVLANVHPAGYPTAEALRGLAVAVEADAGLREAVEIDLQLGGVLGGEKEVLEKVQYGGVAMACTSVAPMAEFAPTLGVLTLPYLFRDREHFWSVLDGPLGDELLAGLEDHGLVGLAWYDAGARSFYNRERSVRSLADLRGLKIRVQQSEILRDTVGALGATPVVMSFKEVFTNLYTGAVDGAENNPPSWVSERHFEVATHLTLDRHTMVPDLLVVQRATWEALAPEVQAGLRAAARRSTAEQRRLWDARERAALEEAVEAGCTVDEVEDPEAFRRAVEPVWERHAGRWGDLPERIRASG